MAFCRECGKPLVEGAPFCAFCGARDSIGEAKATRKKDRAYGIKGAVLALVLSIVCFVCMVLGTVFSSQIEESYDGYIRFENISEQLYKWYEEYKNESNQYKADMYYKSYTEEKMAMEGYYDDYTRNMALGISLTAVGVIALFISLALALKSIRKFAFAKKHLSAKPVATLILGIGALEPVLLGLVFAIMNITYII